MSTDVSAESEVNTCEIMATCTSQLRFRTDSGIVEMMDTLSAQRSYCIVMRIAIDIPHYSAQGWKIIAGACETVSPELSKLSILLPNFPSTKIEDADPKSWDGIITDVLRPDLDIPQVVVEPAQPGGTSVSIDGNEVCQLAIDQFISMGIDSFAFFGFPEWPTTKARWKAFSEQMEKLGVEPVFIDADDPYQMLRQLPKPCGILAYNDYLGNLLIRRCQRIDLRVPDDIQIISIGNLRKCFAIHPHLSSIVMPYVDVGFYARKLCVHMIGGESVESIKLPPSGVILRESTQALNDEIRTAAEIAHYLNTNMSYPIQMADVVRRSSISRRRLEQIFRLNYGQAPIAYLKELRLNRAKDMLTSSDALVKDIAAACGYTDSKHFCRAFRRGTGMTPLLYREEKREDSSDQ